MPLAMKGGKILSNVAGTSLKTGCCGHASLRLVSYTYSPCAYDAGGAHNGHRQLVLCPSVASVSVEPWDTGTILIDWAGAAHAPSGGCSSFGWSYDKDASVIDVIKGKAKSANATKGSSYANVFGNTAEYAYFGGNAFAFFNNGPCCDSECHNGGATFTFGYKATISGNTCGVLRLYYIRHQQSLQTNLYAFASVDRSDWTLRGTVNGESSTWSPFLTISGGDADRTFTRSFTTAADGHLYDMGIAALFTT